MKQLPLNPPYRYDLTEAVEDYATYQAGQKISKAVEKFCHLDAPYCLDGNKIDVYTSAHWTADSKESYQEKEDMIQNYVVENDLFKLFAWCDIGGYEYWVTQQQETNYVSVDVLLKKNPQEYTEAEIQQIVDAVYEAEWHFQGL